MVFILRDLPVELRRIVLWKLHHACMQMSPVELGVVRLVSVRLAATFYKRCIMTTMLNRYKPFVFLGVEIEQCRANKRYYDLHSDFQTPCTLPKEHLDLRDFWRLQAEKRTSEGNNLDLMRLELMHMQVDCGFRSFTDPVALERKLLDHRVRVHQHLKEQEKRLLSLGSRKPERSEHMDDASRDLFPRQWAWI